MGRVYSLVIKHGSLENAPFLGDVPSHKPPFSSGIFQLATFDYPRAYESPIHPHYWRPSSWALEFPLLPLIVPDEWHGLWTFFTHPQPILESQSIHQSIV